MRVLITGATGFVGAALCPALSRNHTLYGLTRRTDAILPPNVEKIVWTQTGNEPPALPEIDAVIHLAARVHVMRESAADPLAAFRAANVQMTRALTQMAAERGAKRFIFLSSIKVNGDSTAPGQAFTADDAPAPQDAYGVSKQEAEQVLAETCAKTDMEFVVIRPPLVYGAGVKGNFDAMLRWMARGVPLPLGAIHHNRRSLVALDNLVSFIETCLTHPAAANQTFLISDGEDVSTTELLRKIAASQGRKARLIPVPESWLRLAARLFGKQAIAQRLLDSLVVDSSKARTLLSWQPPVSMDEQLKKIATHDAHS